MLDTPEAVVEALRENNERPHGLQRTVTAEELVEAAESFEEPDVLVTALLELMATYEFTGEHRKSPVVFARVLKLWDTAPAAFSQWEAHQVFWRFKWVTTSLLQVPEVPLAAIQGWVDQMRTRYGAADHGMQPVAAMGYHVAFHTGTGVADAYDLWATRPRTELSDCQACETRHFAEHQLAAGEDAGALETWRPVLGGSMGCTEEPQMSQARALLPLLRTGREDEARSHHLTGYRQVRGNTGMLDEVGLHLEFCALSRNEGRGLEILAENRPLFEATGAPLARLGFLTGAEVLLARLAEDGHSGTAVAGPPGRNWNAGELLAHVRSEADRITVAFDTRNATTTVGDRRRARLAQRPLLDEPLPLGLRTSLTRPADGQAVPGAVPAAAASAVVEIPQEFVALVLEARRLAAAGHPGEYRLWSRVEERLADGSAAHDDALGPEELLQAEIADQRAYRLARKDRDAESAAELTRAAELYEGLGMPWHALSARSRSLAWLSSSDEADPEAIRAGLDGTLAEAELLKTRAPWTQGADAEGKAERELEYLTVLYSATFAAYQEALRELPETAGPAAQRFAEHAGTMRAEAERLSVPHHVANALQFEADLAARGGDAARAEDGLLAALAAVDASGRPWRGSRPRAVLAQLMLGKGEPARAVELLHQALADAARYDDTDFAVAPTYALLGHAAVHLDDVNGAVRHFSEAAARFDQDGAHDEATDVRSQLAEVLARGGRQADAVAVLESVLAGEGAGGAAAGDERVLAQARLTLARGLRELGEHLPAAEQFLRLADIVSAWEDDGQVLTLVAAEAATALAMADRWDAAAAAYERAVAAHAEAPNPSLIIHMMCEFARLTMQAREADGLDTALEHLTRADAIGAAVPEDAEDFAPWYGRGTVHYRRARVLAEAERFEEALAEAEAAIAAHEEGGEHGEVPRAEAVRVAALIEGNGLARFAEAVARLSAAAARCRQADLQEAAHILDALRQDFLKR
ncbi:hypothetical protein DEJ51_34175 [Streptomyces venezuelae]|uniref:Tetratricopeptide repeat protein n=1 Tax=Streptomyces venezuelae TaxID=54571 RepID=A0A5P2DTN7_STRVZ|nr:hypothetical protein [Streptomyces venezuelae]QES58554.1 hypothetical protein DEJ51_34175 [Streptomyces venezuelae]